MSVWKERRSRSWGGIVAALLSSLVATHVDAGSSRQLVEIADFSHPIVSPYGDHVAFRVDQASIERNAYDSAWYVQKINGMSPALRIADGGVPLRDSAGVSLQPVVFWSPDGRWIYYRAFLDGRLEVWRAAADGSGSEPVTRDTGDVRDFALSADGRTLAYSVGLTRDEVLAAERTEYDRGVRVDRSTPLGQPLFRSGFTAGRFATERLGLMFNRVGLTDSAPDHWKVVDLETWETHALAASEGLPSAPLGGAGGAPDVWKSAVDASHGRVALLRRTDEGSASPRVILAVRSTMGGNAIECRAEACVNKAISAIQWRPGSDEVLFTVSPYDEGFAQSVLGWDVMTGAVREIAMSTGMIAEGRWAPGACGASSSALVCVTAEANRPPRLERIDLERGERRVLFDPNAALAQDLSWIPARLLHWTDDKGERFTGQFYPARATEDGSPSPLFITYYRCVGFVRGGTGDEWPLASLAQSGIATLCINAPSFSSEAEVRYGLGLSSVKSAIATLAAERLIDPARVGMGGLSFGAEVTMWTLIHSDLLAAASMASPTTSEQYYRLGSNIGEDFTTLLRENWQLGDLSGPRDQWDRISPVANLSKVDAPVLMQFAEQEYLHGIDYEIPLMTSRKADLYVFPNEPHNKFQPRHKLAAYERNLDWFRFWLQDYEDPDPAKAEQYRHWREMRAARDAGDWRSEGVTTSEAGAGS